MKVQLADERAVGPAHTLPRLGWTSTPLPRKDGMATRELRFFGDPILSTLCDPVTDFGKGTRELVQDLMDTVELPGRAGLAAPQIGVGLRAFSYNVDGQKGYVLNPELVEVKGERKEITEGCLSVPKLWFPTERASYAAVKGVDLNNEPVFVDGEGIMAQALQHETDHLDGIVYIQRLSKENRRRAMEQIRTSDWF